MGNTRNSKQYTFHVNYNNPDHLKIYRILEDLNKDIHKSVSNFVIKALLNYIGDEDEEDFTNRGTNKKEYGERYVKHKEIELIKDNISAEVTADVMEKVAAFMSKAALSNQPMYNPMFMQQFMQTQTNGTLVQDEKQKAKEETPDETLEEMSLLFAQGNFGEE